MRSKFGLCYIIFLLVYGNVNTVSEIEKINLPFQHLSYYFNQFQDALNYCKSIGQCESESFISKDCWGYEDFCKMEHRYSNPVCFDEKPLLDNNRNYASEEKFYKQADFGYVKEQRDQLKFICQPNSIQYSSLKCTDNLRFCKGRNILIDFSKVSKLNKPLRYSMEVLDRGEIGGQCNLDEKLLRKELSFMSPLQSWAPELQNFVYKKELDCDITIEKPTYILKIDAAVNMYHHFCDFFNLYMSLHVNATDSSAFSTDSHILIWETYSYFSNFGDSWTAFTDYPIWNLNTFKGKKVCFKNVVFPLLPRMIFGLYYNTPLIDECYKSGLFHAFSKFFLHRLNINAEDVGKKLRVTLISRNTRHRKILNQVELVEKLEATNEYEVTAVDLNWQLNFREQLKISANSDILIGMHGAGLTHLLFLPDWAVVFELYNCDDANCYADLARLRGVSYITWQDVSLIKPKQNDSSNNAKFSNYIFDSDEFLRLVKLAALKVNENRRVKDKRFFKMEL